MIALDSLRILKEIAHDIFRPSFFCDAVDVIQFSLLRGLHAALNSSHARMNLLNVNAVAGVKRGLEEELEEFFQVEQNESNKSNAKQQHQNQSNTQANEEQQMS